MASQVELQTTQSVNQANGTPQPVLRRQFHFGDEFLRFISARPSRLSRDS
jgi:hypothetical protein